MCASYHRLAPHESVAWQQHHNSFPAHHPPPDDTGRVVFTRQLWKRDMSDKSQTDPGVLNNKSRTANVSQTGQAETSGSRRSSSTVSLRPRNHSPSPSRGSTAPLTPEESPPFKSTRKRSIDVVEQEDKALSSTEVSPAHSRANSGEQANHICVCPPDPKIPRPRNGMYRARAISINTANLNQHSSYIGSTIKRTSLLKTQALRIPRSQRSSARSGRACLQKRKASGRRPQKRRSFDISSSTRLIAINPSATVVVTASPVTLPDLLARSRSA